jgi:hypothetical protein
MRRVAKYSVLGSAGLAIGAVLHVGLLSLVAAPTADVSLRDPAVPAMIQPLRGEFAVATTVETPDGELLDLKADIEGDLGEVSARYAFEVVSDVGEAVIKPTIITIDRFDSATGQSLMFRTPHLSEGYYIARITLVAANRDERAVFRREVYLRAQGTSVDEIEFDTYYENSRANLGAGMAATTIERTPESAAEPSTQQHVSGNLLATGAVEGRLLFYQNNGSFCPSGIGRNCTGTTYPQSQNKTFRPVKNARLVLVSPTSGFSGFGSTDANGNFQVGWVATSPPHVPNGSLQFRGHKDGLFKLVGADGQEYSLIVGSVPLRDGETVQVGDLKVGSADAPNALFNYYDAANHAWEFALKTSNEIANSWGTVELRGIYQNDGDPSDDEPECYDTCASGRDSYMKLGPASDFQMQTVAHELGHIASHKINPFRNAGDYEYPVRCILVPDEEDCTGNGHSNVSPEWQHVQFEEGFSSFVATAALNTQLAPDPYFCAQTATYCIGVELAMEPSKGRYPNECTQAEARAENQVTRFLWDVYDGVNDTAAGGQAYNETFRFSFAQIVEAVASFSSGTFDRQDDEQLNTARTAFDARDGRNARDFELYFQDPLGSIALARQFNCGYDGAHVP